MMLMLEYDQAEERLSRKGGPIDDSTIDSEVSTKPVHQKMINAYRDEGLDFFGMCNLKFEHHDISYALTIDPSHENISELITEDIQELKQRPDDSHEVQQLRSLLVRLLKVICKLFNLPLDIQPS